MHAQVHSKEAIDAHLAEAKHRTKVLRALLGLARATGRALILPRLLCYCDYMWKARPPLLTLPWPPLLTLRWPPLLTLPWPPLLTLPWSALLIFPWPPLLTLSIRH